MLAFPIPVRLPHVAVLDPLDTVAYAWFLAVFFGLPVLGWVAMAIDIRAAMRRARGALIVVHRYVIETPLWALRDRPECLQELGLHRGCTREEVMAAYRQRVKRVHPDHGGSRRQFERLQQALQAALRLVEAGDAS